MVDNINKINDLSIISWDISYAYTIFFPFYIFLFFTSSSTAAKQRDVYFSNS